MSFPMYDPSGGYRRRAAEKKRRFFLIATFIISLAAGFYWLGGENVKSSEVAYKQQALRLQTEKEAIEKQLTDARVEVQSTQIRYKQLEDKYNLEVPTGPLKELTDILRQQLKDGMAPDRLAFVLRSARPPRNCSEPVQRRFVVRTSASSGPESAVSFANGAITITAQGEPAVSATSQPEAWFDPGKPVTVKFTQLGGQDTVKTQLLPIHHSMVLAGKENRFTVAIGARSFVAVTGDSCDYP